MGWLKTVIFSSLTHYNFGTFQDYKIAGMLTRPDILRPRPEVRGQGRERGPNSVQKYHGPKTTIVIPKHSSTMRWIKSESDRAFH